MIFFKITITFFYVIKILVIAIVTERYFIHNKKSVLTLAKYNALPLGVHKDGLWSKEKLEILRRRLPLKYPYA